MQKTIKRIVAAVGEDPLTAGPLTKALIRARVDEKVAKGRRKVTFTQDQRDTFARERWVYHVERSAQAWLAIASALFLDSGRLTDDLLTDASACKLVRFLAVLDVHHLLLKWVKENSVLLSAVMLEQTATNQKAASDLRKKISELPEIGSVPKEAVLGFGRVREHCDTLRQMSLRKMKSQPFRMRLYAEAQNILYIKRGMPSALPEDVEAGLLEHRATLSTTRGLPRGASPTWRRILDDKEEITLALGDLVAAVFGKKEFVPVEQCPSTNAGFGAPRGKGGAFQHLASLGGLAKARLLVAAVLSLPRLCYMHETRPGRVVAVFSLGGQEELLRQVGELVSIGARAEFESNPGGLIDAEPAAIVEPCKLRVITKGRPTAYHRGLSLQKFLHGTMRRVDVFQYIGHPIRLSNWTMPVELGPGEFYVSGDYKGATDNLDPSLSVAAWEAICRNVHCDGIPLAFHSLWHTLGRQLLVGHRLHYRRVVEDPSARLPVEQAWGQLMGSPASFPILNLVNAAATAVGTGWRSEPTDAPYVSVLAHLRSIHCVTNGDDVAFVTTPPCYEVWQRVVTSAGLAPSLGKNYTSPHFCIMNSEMRCPLRTAGPDHLTTNWDALGDELVNPDGEVCVADVSTPPLRAWREVRFLNLPILFGIESKGLEAGKSVVDRLCWWELRGLSLSLCADCPPEVLDRRMSFFVQYYADVLKRVPNGVNYYVPPCLGGIGLVHNLSHKWNVPELTRKRAGYLACLDPVKRIEAVTPPSDVWSWGNFKRFRSKGPIATVKTLVEPEMSELELVENQWMVEAGVLPNLSRPVGSNPLDAFSQHCWGAFIDGSDYEQHREPEKKDDGTRVDPAEEVVRTRELRERKMSQRIFRQNARSKASSCKPATDDCFATWHETRVLSVKELYPTLRIHLETALPGQELRQGWGEGLDLLAGDRSDPWLGTVSQKPRDCDFQQTAVRRALSQILPSSVYDEEFGLDCENISEKHQEIMHDSCLLRGLTTHCDISPIGTNGLFYATGDSEISSTCFRSSPENALEAQLQDREAPNHFLWPVQTHRATHTCAPWDLLRQQGAKELFLSLCDGMPDWQTIERPV